MNTNHAIPLVLLIIGSAVVPLGCEDKMECDLPDGTYFCDGNDVMDCSVYEPGSPGNFLSTVSSHEVLIHNCDDYDAQCIEWDRNKASIPEAVCQLSPDPCPNDAVLICVNNRVAECTSRGALLYGDCEGAGETCVEDYEEVGRAACVE